MNDKPKNESDAVKPSADKPEAGKVKEPTATARAYKEQPISQTAADNAHVATGETAQRTDVATKADLAEAKGELKDEIRKTEIRLNNKIVETAAETESKLRAEIKDSEKRMEKMMDEKILNLRLNLEKQAEASEKRLQNLIFSTAIAAIIIIISVLSLVMSFLIGK